MIAAGMRIDKYELVRLIGRGGFGVVFVAIDHSLGRECALKFLLPEHAARADLLERFIQEAQAAARIGHPSIVTVFECGVFRDTGTPADGVAYIAMELLEGESLGARLARGPAFTEVAAIVLVRQVAAALGAAHAEGIVHRDLKPDNIFLVPDTSTIGGERVKVLDFGIAKLAEPTRPPEAPEVLTATYAVFGTPRYMSPEQCRSSTNVDARSDIYALGCIMFELVCGKAPFAGESGEQLAHHQLTAPPTVRSARGEISEVYDTTVSAMLAKQPDHRPPSMDAVVRLLDRPFAAGTRLDPIPVASPTPTVMSIVPEPSRPPRRTRRPIAIVAIVALVAIAGVAILIGTHRASARDEPAMSDAERKCRANIATEDWGALADCAEDLRGKGQIPVADELAAMVKREMPSMAASRELADMMPRYPSVDDIAAQFGKIDPASRYAKVARQVIKTYIRGQGQLLADYHQCRALDDLRTASGQLALDTQEELLKVACLPRGEIQRACASDTLPDDLKTLIASARWGAILPALVEWIDCRRNHALDPTQETLAAAVTAACHVHAMMLARGLYPSIGDDARAGVVAACKDAGVPL